MMHSMLVHCENTTTLQSTGSFFSSETNAASFVDACQSKFFMVARMRSLSSASFEMLIADDEDEEEEAAAVAAF